MNNYEYIVASLPVLASDYRGPLDTDEIIGEIRSQLSPKDEVLLDTLLKGFDADSRDAEFYRKALASRDRFIAGYFSYDLDVRNCRVAYLNKALGRPEGQDIMVLDEDEPREFEDLEKVNAVLQGSDILGRERGLDDILWERIDSLTLMEAFTLDQILGFVAKLQIVARWLRLDPQTGRELFRHLVEEIRNNKKSIE